MKKQIMSFLAITSFYLVFSFYSNAQNWLTAGNGSNATSAFLGTTSSGTGYKDLVFKTVSVERIKILATNGNVGIGTSTTTITPYARLDVTEATSANTVQMLRRGPQRNGAAEDQNMVSTFGSPYMKIGGSEFKASVQTIQTVGFGYNQTNENPSYQPAEIGFLTTSTADHTLGDIVFATRNTPSNVPPTEVMRITSNGNVGIGTLVPDAAGYKLSVKGGIRCHQVVVETGWADYVFHKDYKLMPIHELEKFVSANKHLPNIPAGTEIEKNGLDLGSVQAKQMEKIEELTLYIIELNKRIADLEKMQAKK